ncbi:dipeptide/oligopeptide/nickel ABC transporter permease/ATP-binding protein [Tomitella gaofuii]|uniref:dipeptide/oligopeptide/nickel ABC transporter permease/ATP-binding protein n=1 Tax=Tomitella gaofuii TaxID=2760083 RepID=UPI001F3C4D66|nr:dipeptide/oligopeptide/nickel ABC transporter permease/ATP-binding protein [Tomitella gaofuii]
MTRRTMPDGLSRVLHNRVAVVSGLVLIAIIVVAAIAPAIAPFTPGHSSLDAVLAPPSGTHLLGGDGSGRDVLSRLLYGAGTTLVSAAIALAVALVIGFPTGLAAGYFARALDATLTWIFDLLLAVPAIVILLTLAPIVDNDINSVMVMLGVVISPAIYRLTRSTVQAVRAEPYVDAARVFGLSHRRIMLRHVAVNVRGPLIVSSSLVAAAAIMIQAGLEFIGVGGGTTARVSWGSMLSDALTDRSAAPLLFIAPGVAIGITACALALFGSAMADALGAAGRGEESRTGDAGAALGDDRDAQRGVPGIGDVEGARDERRTEQSVAVVHADGPGGETLLDLRDLRVRYPDGSGGGREVVSGVTLQVRRGEIVGLVGESGSGKSQTSFAALGLLPPNAHMTAASFTVAGRAVSSMKADERRALCGPVIGYVPQEPLSNLDPCWSIGSQLTEPIRFHQGLSRSDARAKAEELLAHVGIPDPVGIMRKYPHEISGGMAQRVLIAGALSCDPDLLIADEPTTALDVTVQAEVLGLLRRLQAERNLGVLLVTHSFGVVADLCDRVAVMRAGRIVEDRPARDLFAAPRHDYTALLLESTLDGGEPRAEYAYGDA